MRLLLDTHVVLWWLTDDPALADDVKIGLDEETEAYVSAASIWEVAIKQAAGKLAAGVDLAEAVIAGGFRELPITVGHAAAASGLPPLHRDPFDRMLVAQARAEGLTLATRDPQICRYEVDLLRV